VVFASTRECPAFQPLDTRDVGCSDEMQRAAIRAHEREEIGFLLDRHFALAGIIGDDIVEPAEADLIAIIEDRGDLRDRALGRLGGDGEALLGEDALIDTGEDRSGAGAGKIRHGDARLGTRRKQRREQGDRDTEGERPSRHDIPPLSLSASLCREVAI
jgi:hypothetical protein